MSDEKDIVEVLRSFETAYPEDVFVPFTGEELKQHQTVITRASGAMGRHCSQFMSIAADEIDRLRGVLSGDASLVGVHLEKHGIDIGVQHPLVHVMADALANMLGEHNYCEMQMKSQKTGDEYLMHLQRLARPTPSELKRRAEDAFRAVRNHWREFGPDGLDEVIETTAKSCGLD